MSRLARFGALVAFVAPLLAACSAAPTEESQKSEEAVTCPGCGPGVSGLPSSPDAPTYCPSVDPGCSIVPAQDLTFYNTLKMMGYSCSAPRTYETATTYAVAVINYTLCTDSPAMFPRPSLRDFVRNSPGGQAAGFTGPGWTLGKQMEAVEPSMCSSCLPQANTGQVYVFWLPGNGNMTPPAKPGCCTKSCMGPYI